MEFHPPPLPNSFPLPPHTPIPVPKHSCPHPTPRSPRVTHQIVPSARPPMGSPLYHPHVSPTVPPLPPPPRVTHTSDVGLLYSPLHVTPPVSPTNTPTRALPTPSRVGLPQPPLPRSPSTPPPRRPVPAGVPSAPGPAGDPPRPRVGSWRCHVRRSGGDLSGGGVAAPPAATVSRPKCPPGRGRKWEGGVGPTLWPRPLHRPPSPTSGPFNPFRVGGETREEGPPHRGTE